MRKFYVILAYLTFVKSADMPAIPMEIIQTLVSQISSKVLCDGDLTAFNVSEGCAQQMQIVCKNTDVALAMLDASSKFPYAGVLYAGRSDFGNFDECMEINFSDGENAVLGKYCFGGLIIPDPKDPTNIENMYKLAVCMPNMCSAQDLIYMGKSLFAEFPPVFTDGFCSSNADGNDISIMSMVTIAFFVFISMVMILSTLVDYYLHKMEVKCTKPALLAFSLYSNIDKLFHTSESNTDQIEVFHGIKVISMLWIIAGHGYTIWLMDLLNNVTMIPVANYKDIKTYHFNMYSSYIDGAHFAVDTFFFISGFLAAYNYLRMKNTPLVGQLKAIPYLYLHRFIRICIPVYMLFFFGYWIFPMLGGGPLWKPALPIVKGCCEDYWWTYFLFIQNYVNYNELCMTHTWYLSADVQMSVLAPFIMIPMTVSLQRKNGLIKSILGLFVLTTISIVLPIYLKLQFDYNNIYDTHSRFVDYLIGMTLAVFMRETKGACFLLGVHEKLKPIINLLVWITVIIGMFVALMFYSNAEVYQGHTSKAYYYMLSRSAWCTGLAWLVYSCYHGYGGLVNWILCRPIFQVVGRLTYSMYLLHFLVIGYHTLHTRTRLFFSDYTQYYSWCGYVITTFVISIFWTLAFETPVLIIEKAFSGKVRNNTNGNIQRREHSKITDKTEIYRHKSPELFM